MTPRGRHGCVLAALLAALLAASEGGQAGTQAKRAAPPSPPAPVAAPMPAQAPPEGYTYRSEGRRDPFLNPTLSGKKDENPDEEEPKGPPPPGISGMLITQVRLLGTSFGDDSPVAVFQGPDKRAYFLQERDRLFDGYVKQVGTDFVLMVRETKLRSGKIVTQEVTKQLRTP